MSKKKAGSRAKRGRRSQPSFVHQFLVVLSGTDPLVWRRIEVPEDYSFWDLHVAIQDAMGWLDYHLHEFQVINPKTNRLEWIGIPTGEFESDREVKPGWLVAISDYFSWQSHLADYTYDFGDDWKHTVVLEDREPLNPGLSYPILVGGARACPPEDVGGAYGYQLFLEAIQDQNHPEHQDMLEWVGLSHRSHAVPSTLSGGEQQRVAIARAVIARPELLVADEPTGNVDPDMALKLLRLFEALNRLGTTVVVATHDVHLIKKVSNSLIMRLDKGRLFDPTGALRYPPRPGGTPSAQRAQDGVEP